MMLPFSRLLFISIALSVAFLAMANQAPVLKPDVASVAEGGNVMIDVLANDVEPDGSFDLGSMYIASEASNGYLGIDARGRISYTHYGGTTTSDRFSYVIADDEGHEGRAAVVYVAIGEDADTRRDKLLQDIVAELEESPVQPGNTGVTASTAEPVIRPKASVTTNGVVSAFHRSGQTFLTWQETAARDSYHVYRHTQPITVDTIRRAKRLTDKWGALGSNTSVNVHGSDAVPDHFVIDDLAEPLNDSTGLFVYTTQPGDSARAYYAVTSVRGGRERTLLSLGTSISEKVAAPSDVLTVSTNLGRGRVYTQFMDYSRWNPTLNGYGYNYAVALPHDYNPKQKYPLMVELHAYQEQHKFVDQAEYNWAVIQLFPADPGQPTGALHSWWYGYSDSHDYRLTGTLPTSGHIENYTEQRVMRAINSVVASTSVNRQLIYGSGNSMGASGMLALAVRYGSVFSGVYANQPMTNYAADKVFAREFQRIWGKTAHNLPVRNRGLYSESIGGENIGVWDWMNHQQQLIRRRGSDKAFLMTLHGKQDQIIEWKTQGKPFIRALNQAGAGFTATMEEVGHSWVGFSAAVNSLFGFGYDENFPYRYPLEMSYPSVQVASLSGPTIPADTGRDTYNMNVEWATPHTPFAAAIVDQPSNYEVSIRSTEGNQIADITPRRTQRFKVRPGQQCHYSAVENNNGELLARGKIIADRDALLTVKRMPVVGGAGTRLVINCR